MSHDIAATAVLGGLVLIFIILAASWDRIYKVVCPGPVRYNYQRLPSGAMAQGFACVYWAGAAKLMVPFVEYGYNAAGAWWTLLFVIALGDLGLFLWSISRAIRG